MRKFRSLLSICLVIMLSCCLSISAYASDLLTEPEEVCVTTTESERDAVFLKAMSEIYIHQLLDYLHNHLMFYTYKVYNLSYSDI